MTDLDLASVRPGGFVRVQRRALWLFHRTESISGACFSVRSSAPSSGNPRCRDHVFRYLAPRGRFAIAILIRTIADRPFMRSCHALPEAAVTIVDDRLTVPRELLDMSVEPLAREMAVATQLLHPHAPKQRSSWSSSND